MSGDGQENRGLVIFGITGDISISISKLREITIYFPQMQVMPGTKGQYSLKYYFPYRHCPPTQYCDQYPCRHTPCKDPDWIVQIMDRVEHPDLAREATLCFLIPSRIKDVPAEDRKS